MNVKKYNHMGIIPDLWERYMDVEGYCLCQDPKKCVLVGKTTIWYVTLEATGIQTLEYERHPLMSAINLHEI